MTGMGEDGAAGLGALQAAGGLTAAQSPDTCVVDSMPRSAIERGFVSHVVTLPNHGELPADRVLDGPAQDRTGRRKFYRARRRR